MGCGVNLKVWPYLTKQRNLLLKNCFTPTTNKTTSSNCVSSIAIDQNAFGLARDTQNTLHRDRSVRYSSAVHHNSPCRQQFHRRCTARFPWFIVLTKWKLASGDHSLFSEDFHYEPWRYSWNLSQVTKTTALWERLFKLFLRWILGIPAITTLIWQLWLLVVSIQQQIHKSFSQNRQRLSKRLSSFEEKDLSHWATWANRA